MSCAGGGLVVASPARAAIAYTAYVGNYKSDTVTPINTATNATSSNISVSQPSAIAITPDGTKAYVCNYAKEQPAGTVTPITLATGVAGSPITVGAEPNAIAITPDGTKAYVSNYDKNSKEGAGIGTVTVITLSNGKTSTIAVGKGPYGVAITPDGTKAYVANHYDGTVTPITTATDKAGTPITVGTGGNVARPDWVAISPDGSKAYAANFGTSEVVPITVATDTAGTPITGVTEPNAIAITSDGATAYIAEEGSPGHVVPMTLSNNKLGPAITVGNWPYDIAITPDQASAYVADYNKELASFVTPINLQTSTAGTNITAGNGPDTVAITPDQAPVASFTVTAGAAGSSTSFDASASTVAYGSITSYAWNFGDTNTATTSTPTTTHVYASVGSYTATVTETDSAGTSTTQVFNGKTVSRNGGASAKTSRSVSIVPPPANISLPAITGTAQQGQTLTEVHGGWTNEPTSFTYQWQQCDGSGNSCSSISGATSQTYVPVAEDAGHTLRVQEIATNSGGSSSPAESPATAVVKAAPPAALVPLATASALTSLLAPKLPPASSGPPAPTPVVISTRSLTVTARGDVVIELSCPASARGGCRGKVTIRLAEPRARRARALAARCARGCRALGSANYEARGGQKISVRVHMASFGRHLLLRRKALRVTVTATSVSGGHTATTVRTTTLRAHTRLA